MLSTCLVQNTAHVGLIGVQIMLLTAKDIRLNLFLDFACCVELSAASVKSESVDIHGVYSKVISLFFN